MWYGTQLFWKHPGCASWSLVNFGVGGHTLVQASPLTVSPALRCPQKCGTHGSILEGKWVPA